MDEMRGDISGSTSGSVKAFFFKCLISVGVSDHGVNGGCGALLFELFLLGAALLGIVPLELAVEALTASLQFGCQWHNVVPCGSSSNCRFLWKDGSAEI
jgi:hypothetical protein